MASLERSLADLAVHLHARREVTLQAWRKAVKADRMLTMNKGQLTENAKAAVPA